MLRRFADELAAENDYLRQENRILRGKLGKRVQLTEAERRTLVKYGMRIRDRLREIVSIVKPETLDRMILVGPGHLRRALRAIETHHNAQRPHQGIGNVVPAGYDYPAEPRPPDKVRRVEGLGGLLNHYEADEAA